MKALEIFSYPDSLIEATLSFLHNTELLTVFISILFNKTNAYDSYSLCTSISIAT